MEAIDNVYEYAGYQAALALWATLTGYGIPLIVALGGVAWRFLRVAEDGLVRPLMFYLMGLVVLWWLVSPAPVVMAWQIRAPRFASLLTGAADLAQRGMIRGIDSRFLSTPFEWERLAAISGTAYVTNEGLATNLRDFHKRCYLPALARSGAAPSESARMNPLNADTGLPYELFTPPLNFMAVAGHTMTCADARRVLHDELKRYVQQSNGFVAAMNSARNLNGSLDANLYFDQLVANTIHGRAEASDMAMTRLAVGVYDPGDPRQNAVKAGSDAPGWFASAFGWLMSELTRLLTPVSEATAAKVRYYRVTASAPQVYGLTVMLLLALFPLVALWALLPGGWRALANFTKLFLSVKLWPVGWCLLSTFTSRRPPSEAITAAGGSSVDTGNIFVTLSSMYFVVPVLTFVVVNIAASAAAIPFKDALPAIGGGGRGAAIGGGLNAAAAA